MTFDDWFDHEGYDEQHRLVFGLAWNAGMDTERDSHRIVTDGPFFNMMQLETKVAAERERAARVCDDEARIRTEAGSKHGAGTPAFDRCMAAARAARNCALGVRGGEVVGPNVLSTRL